MNGNVIAADYSISVDGKTVINSSVSNTTAAGAFVIPVSKGNVVKVSCSPRTSGYCCYYIPPVGVVPPTVPLAYSTSEQDTGKTWIDGKKIYRITVLLNNPASFTATNWLDSNVNAPAGIERLVSSSIMVLEAATDSGTVPNAFFAGVKNSKWWILSPCAVSGWTVNTLYLTAEYTKA